MTVHNDGSQIRSWYFIDDIVDGILLVLTRDEAIAELQHRQRPLHGDHPPTGPRHRPLANSTSEVDYIRWDHPDVELRVPDISKARDLLNYSPRIDLEEGLKRTIAWYRQEMGKSKILRSGFSGGPSCRSWATSDGCARRQLLRGGGSGAGVSGQTAAV